MKLVLIFLALCALVFASVPRDRRATEEQAKKLEPKKPEVKYCAPTTPCGWTVIENKTEEDKSSIKNTYCICPAEASWCKPIFIDEAAHAWVHRCVPEVEETEHS